MPAAAAPLPPSYQTSYQAPPPTAASATASYPSGSDFPLPPDLHALVAKEAEAFLPAEARQPLLLLRVSMLLQDAVEAACMCARAHIDAPLLAKHLLGAEQHQHFLAAQAEAAGDASAAERAERVAEFAQAVASTVGEVRRRSHAQQAASERTATPSRKDNQHLPSSASSRPFCSHADARSPLACVVFAGARPEPRRRAAPPVHHRPPRCRQAAARASPATHFARIAHDHAGADHGSGIRQRHRRLVWRVVGSGRAGERRARRLTLAARVY